jgi:hypothetical protein
VFPKIKTKKIAWKLIEKHLQKEQIRAEIWNFSSSKREIDSQQKEKSLHLKEMERELRLFL